MLPNTSSNYARFYVLRQTLLIVCLCVSFYPDFPPCNPIKCQYNGTCIAVGFKPVCSCAKYFHGARCESKYKLLLVALFTGFPYTCKPKISKGIAYIDTFVLNRIINNTSAYENLPALPEIHEYP